MRRCGLSQRAIAPLDGRSRTRLLIIFFALGMFASFGSRSARAQTTAPPTPLEATVPPPLDIPYIQFGVAFTTELVTNAGKMCGASTPAVPVPCILGSGGGVVARLGRRSAGPWYFGGAYELSKQDPSSLYRFATLQQLRAEARWYLDTGRDIYPYATATSGAATYGNEWGIDTYGPIESLGLGMEAQVSRRTVVGFALSYRVLVLNDYYDSGGYERGASMVQMLGLDLFVEERSPIVQAVKTGTR
jgi:hypothetical protein